MSTPNPLKRTTIHKKLALRLLIAAVLISVVLGLVATLNQWNMLGETVLNQAAQNSIFLNTHLLPYLDEPGVPGSADMERSLLTFMTQSARNRFGRHVIVRIYRGDGTRAAGYLDNSYPDIDPVAGWYDSMDDLPSDSVPWHRVEKSGGSPYILVGIPLQNSLGVVVARAEGVFAVSPETVRIVRFRAVKIGLAVMLIVLVTTAILYPVIMILLRRITILTLNLLDSHLEMLKILGSAIAQRDSDTDAHNYRVTIMSVRIAEELDLPASDIQTLVKGAFLHDVGKIGIPDNILLKPGKLDEEEFTVMKTHVNHGVEIVGKSRWLEDALKIVEYHHEKMSGEGYPHRFGQEEIPIFARIFAVADVFDALTSRRPYKEPFPFDYSMSMMEEGRGSHFDPVVFDTFKGIARSLYDDLSGEEEKPKQILEGIIDKYFGEDAQVLEI